jgi:hypothetical protein
VSHIVSLICAKPSRQISKKTATSRARASRWDGRTAYGWLTSAGGLEREKLVTALTRSVTKALEGTFVSSTWDDTTDELTLKVKIKNQSVSRLALTDLMQIKFLFGPPKIGKSDLLIIWVGEMLLSTVDGETGSQLRFTENRQSSDANDVLAAQRQVITSILATDLGGRIWKAEWLDPKDIGRGDEP